MRLVLAVALLLAAGCTEKLPVETTPIPVEPKIAVTPDSVQAIFGQHCSKCHGGDFPLAPRSDHCTDTCGFGPVCRIAQTRNTGKVFPLALPALPKEKDGG